MKFLAITENHLYRRAYKNGRRVSTGSLSLYVLRDRHAALLKKQHPEKRSVNRIGISASKKIGGAVQRNRAKRVIREAYRQIDKNTGVRTGYLIVIVPRPACTVLKMQEVKRDLQYALARVELIDKEQKQTCSAVCTASAPPTGVAETAETARDGENDDA